MNSYRPSRHTFRASSASRTALLVLIMAGASTAAYAQDARVLVDQQPVTFGNSGPRVEPGGRVLVPLRGVFEQMGADVAYDQDTRTVRATRGDTRMSLTVGSGKARVNDQEITLDAPVRLTDGSVMVPLRVISEHLGATVDWDRSSRTVTIDTTDLTAASATTEGSTTSDPGSMSSTATPAPDADTSAATGSATTDPNMAQPPGPAGATAPAPETSAPARSESVPTAPAVVVPEADTATGFDWARWAPWIVGALLLLGLLLYLATRGRGGSVIAARGDRRTQ